MEHLWDLRRLGVASLKIEGRMKRPEYVAVVTKAYRTALDGKRVTEEDLRELEAVFSRQGFTQGYYEGKTGADMFGGGRSRRRTASCSPLRARRMSRARTSAWRPLLRDDRPGQPAQLAVEDDAGHLQDRTALCRRRPWCAR